MKQQRRNACPLEESQSSSDSCPEMESPNHVPSNHDVLLIRVPTITADDHPNFMHNRPKYFIKNQSGSDDSDGVSQF